MKYWKTTSGAVGFAMLSAALVLASSDDLIAPAPASGTSAMTVVQADPHVEERFARIEERGAKVPAKKRAQAERKITAALQSVSDREVRDGAEKVAGRIASEFRTSGDKVLADRDATGASLGELMLAYTLELNTTHSVTAPQLIELHDRGVGWAQIGAGLGFQLGEVVAAADAESRVAAGKTAPDGKVQQLIGDAHVGVGPVPGASRDGASDPAFPELGKGSNNPIPGNPSKP